MHDLLIAGANLVSASYTGPYDIAVDDGLIAAVAPRGELPAARSVWAADGLTVIPGLVDAHVHFRDPASPERETFRSGSAAAAAGGVTTVLEMPTSSPSVMTVDILRARAAHLADRSHVDFALFGGAGAGNLAEIGPMAEAGAVAFKTFMHAPPPGREDVLGPLSVVDAADLLPVLGAVARTGLVHALHSEDESVLGAAERAALRARLGFGASHARSRPPLAEELAVATAVVLGRDVRAKLHFVHVSCAESVRHVVDERRAGLDASVETCPHYLAFNDDVLATFGPYAKCNPPLRDEATRTAMVRALRTGDVEIVASDHCPCAPDELSDEAPDFRSSPAGLAGIEFMLPTLLTLVDRGELDLPGVVRATSWAPARRFGLAGKGDIRAGLHADLVAVDLAGKWRYGDRPLFSKGAANARYLTGFPFAGSVERTWLRGRPVFEEGRIVTRPGAGVWLKGAAGI